MAAPTTGRTQANPEHRDALPRGVLPLVKQAFTDWKDDDAPRLAASLSFYTALSVAPLLVIAISVAGLVLGEEAARGQVVSELRGLMGQGSAQTVESMVESTASKPRTGVLSTIFGVVMLLFGASGVFGELQSSLNSIWEVKPKPERGIWNVIRQRFLSMTMVVGIGFLLLVSLIVSSVLAAASKWAAGLLPGAPIIWQVVTFAVSFGLITALFAVMFKVLPDVKIRWKDVWVGAAATALLFTVGKLLIGLYLGRASMTSSYGAAASTVVFLLWVYYSSQILFFGAELTQVYARMYGAQIVPSKNAVPTDPMSDPEQNGARAQVGSHHVTRQQQPAAAPPQAGASTARTTPGLGGLPLRRSQTH